MTNNEMTGADSLPPRVKVQQAAEFYGMDRKSIRRLIASGALKAYRVGPRMIRIDRDSLLKLGQPIGGVL